MDSDPLKQRKELSPTLHDSQFYFLFVCLFRCLSILVFKKLSISFQVKAALASSSIFTFVFAWKKEKSKLSISKQPSPIVLPTGNRIKTSMNCKTIIKTF